MAAAQPRVFDVEDTHASLDGAGTATPHDITPDFYQRLMAGQADVSGVWMVGGVVGTQDAPDWTLHPSGDCMIVLLSGAVGVVIDGDDGERLMELRPGQACLVPQGLWHRTVVRQPGLRMFVTAGSGTRTRPVEP